MKQTLYISKQMERILFLRFAIYYPKKKKKILFLELIYHIYDGSFKWIRSCCNFYAYVYAG